MSETLNSYLPVPGITGTDGAVPVYNPNGRWSIWNLKEIYLGKEGNQRYVPNVGDLVLDVEFFIYYEVKAIDQVTFVPTLQKKDTRELSGEFTDVDILLGPGPGTQSDTYRVYIDKTVVPYTLAVDARLRVAGTMCASCKIFKGTDPSQESSVISMLFDGSGNFLGNSIPLELAAVIGDNKSIKTVPTCYTKEDLEDGEVVVAVFYSETGHVVSRRQLLVENTSFIRSTDDTVKYITGISLKSPFMSDSDPNLIEYPINVPVPGLFLMGVVHYSDGTSQELPVDGSKFSVFGLDNFIATVIGQKFDLVLKYNLSPGEICYGAQMTTDRFITKSYKSVVAQANGAYTLKLFGYPHWIDGVSGYRMEWFLYNLDRSIHQRVTPYVRLTENSAPFDPMLYGTRQRMNVALNLQDVSSIYTNYRHAQTIDVTLITAGGDNGTNWMVGFDPAQNPQFGVGNKFKYQFVNADLKKLRIDMGKATVEDWLNQLYYPTKPLVDPYREADPIVPDYFAIVVGAERKEYKLEDWTSLFTISEPIWHGATVFIEFFKRTITNDIQLAVAGIPVEQVQDLQ